MFRYSFMNYECVRRLLDEGVRECDFVAWYIDANGSMYATTIGHLVKGMILIGYSRK